MNKPIFKSSDAQGIAQSIDRLIIFSYGPHPNTHRGRHNVPSGRGVWPFCSQVHLYGE